MVSLLHARLPPVPLLLWLQHRSVAALRVAVRAARLRVRSVLVADEPVLDTLHQDLTHPVDLGGDVVHWLRHRGLHLSTQLADLVMRIFDHAPAHADLASLLRSVGVAESTTRFRFRKKHLPPPHHWLQTARALHFALRIQAEPQKSLLILALETGYSDHTTISKRTRRSFEVRPSAIRGTLGWEWLLDRWYHRNVERGKAGRQAPI